MAVTVTTVFSDANKVIADVEATADADVAAVIPHVMGVAPCEIAITPLAAEFYVSAPTLGVVDANNVNIVMLNAVGSGAAGNQIRVCARRCPEPW